MIYYGQAGSFGSEVDLVIVEKVPVTDEEQPRCNMFMCSVKRSESQQVSIESSVGLYEPAVGS